MQFSQVTCALLYMAATVSAGCYTRGNAGGTGDGQKGKGLNQNNVIDAIADLMQGNYLAGEERTQCAMDTLNNKWKFWLKVSSTTRRSGISALSHVWARVTATNPAAFIFRTITVKRSISARA